MINEPETEKKMEFVISLDQCFHEEELQRINKRDINQLKKLAKILVEERAVIKRISEENEGT